MTNPQRIHVGNANCATNFRRQCLDIIEIDAASNTGCKYKRNNR